jgi:hypothetical protein
MIKRTQQLDQQKIYGKHKAHVASLELVVIDFKVNGTLDFKVGCGL